MLCTICYILYATNDVLYALKTWAFQQYFYRLPHRTDTEPNRTVLKPKHRTVPNRRVDGGEDGVDGGWLEAQVAGRWGLEGWMEVAGWWVGWKSVVNPNRTAPHRTVND